MTVRSDIDLAKVVSELAKKREVFNALVTMNPLVIKIAGRKAVMMYVRKIKPESEGHICPDCGGYNISHPNLLECSCYTLGYGWCD